MSEINKDICHFCKGEGKVYFELPAGTKAAWRLCGNCKELA